MKRLLALLVSVLCLTLGLAGNAGAEVITHYTLPPDKLAQAEALYRTHLIMYVIGLVYGLVVLVAILAWRLAPRFRDLAERSSQRRFLQVLVFAPLLLLSMDVLSLPLEVYGQQLQLSYGLSVQGWASWAWDSVKGELIGIAIGTLLIAGLYALLRRSPTRWWFYGWLASIPILLLLVLIAPVFISPLFNKFDPLMIKQPKLVPLLEQVMARGGITIERSRMFQMQASDKVTTYNAYVTGIGASKRVVVWDNTARDLSNPETMFVFGHEQGHYVLNHVWQGLALTIAGLFVGLYVAYRTLGGLLARYGQRWGVRGPGDLASLPALLLILSLFDIISRPITAGFSRHIEHQADIYGLEVTHGLVADSPQVAAHAFQKFGEKALTYPHPAPLFVIFAFDHPPLGERVEFAANYRPWENGGKMRYVQ